MNREQIAALIDHTLLKPESTRAEVEAHCRQALTHPFATVCVQPLWTSLCASVLRGTRVKPATVVDFPFGLSSTKIKIAQTVQACEDGAKELDMVLHVGALKSGDDRTAEEGIRAVVGAAGSVPVKVIIETCYLTREEKVRACRMVESCGARFVKTSTSFGPAGATVEDVALMRQTVGDRLGVKASGGIRDLQTFLRMVEAGASRIGTSSALKILEASNQ